MPLLLFFFTFCKGQDKTYLPKGSSSEPKTISPALTKIIPPVNDPYFVKRQDTISTHGPHSITRNMLQDKKGNYWFATWEGIIRYDGKVFTNFTLKEDLIKFHVFSVLEDKKGNLWFGTIRGGVYRYDPTAKLRTGSESFTLFTTVEGLAHNIVGCIFEDKTGNIWFGTQDGASCYDGNSFRNFTTKEGLSNNDVNAIIEDNTGKLWFGTRGDGVCFYDGNNFHNFKNKEGLPFNQVRSIIKDKNGNLWFGGNDGLWRYDGKLFTNFTTNFVGYIYEDKKGNIWTSSEGATPRNWLLSRYNENTLSNEQTEPDIIKKQDGQIFGILEDTNGNIWFGGENGVYRYDGKLFTNFAD